jgi:hypothetical protein
VQLQGKEKEKGFYECRWKNSKGEPRHKKFIIIFIEKEANTLSIVSNVIIIFSILFGLLGVAVRIGIKVYLDKVKDFYRY